MVGDLGRNWHVIGWSTNEQGQAGADNPLYASIVKRVLPKGDAQIGVPPNVANWSLGYDAVLLYADIMRRTGIDGNTDPKKARELIKNEFVKLKTFTGAYKYTMRDTGDAHIPATVLIADVEKKQWKFLLPQAR
jgi:branched-chain amino acid transport system substrate-binding protein